MKKFIDLDDMVNANSAYVMNLIYTSGGISRREISEKSGLSWGGTTKIVNRLLENGYVREEKSASTSSAGRNAHILRMNEDKHRILGLDFNKTGFRALVITCAGKPLKSFEHAVHSENVQTLWEEFLLFAKGILEEFEPGAISAVGIAMQGVVDAENGVSVRFPGAENWKNVPIREIIEETFGIPAFVEHDPNCLLYPLIASHPSNTLLFRIDKSIGAAAFLNGSILKGTGILEIAHNVMLPNGKECTCGAKGCLEAYIAPCTTETGVSPSVLKEMCLPLAMSIKNTALLLGVDTVILTGRLIRYRALFEEMLREALSSLSASVKTELIENSDSACEGAALIALDRWIHTMKI